MARGASKVKGDRYRAAGARRQRGGALPLLLGLICSAAIASVFYWYISEELPRQDLQRQQTVVSELSQQLAQRIEARLEYFTNAGQTLREQPEIGEAVKEYWALLETQSSGQALNRISTAEKRLATGLEATVTLVPITELGTADGDNIKLQTLGLIELDLVRRSLKQNKAPTEALTKGDNPGLLYALSGHPDAVLLLRWPLTLLQDSLKGANQYSARLIQRQGERKQILAEVRSEQVGSIQDRQNLTIEGWYVSLVLDRKMERTLSQSNTSLFILGGCAVIAPLLLGLLMSFSGGRRRAPAPSGPGLFSRLLSRGKAAEKSSSKNSKKKKSKEKNPTDSDETDEQAAEESEAVDYSMMPPPDIIRGISLTELSEEELPEPVAPVAPSQAAKQPPSETKPAPKQSVQTSKPDESKPEPSAVIKPTPAPEPSPEPEPEPKPEPKPKAQPEPKQEVAQEQHPEEDEANEVIDLGAVEPPLETEEIEISSLPDFSVDLNADDSSGDTPEPPQASEIQLDFHRVFRAYDIRGHADKQLPDSLCEQIGRALGSEIRDRGQDEIIVSRDGRLSSERITEALVRGLLASGMKISDLGLMPTPVMHFATWQLGIGNAVMVTGSHNGPECNGMKMVIDRQSLTKDCIQGLKHRIEDERYIEGHGRRVSAQVAWEYVDFIKDQIHLKKPPKIVIDASNGATSSLAPKLFQALGCEVVPLFCEFDGSFPNHAPDPTIESNVSQLKQAIARERADIGLAFDGDGDRIACVTRNGRHLRSDELLLLLSRDVLRRNPGGAVVFDVKCSASLKHDILENGGEPIMWKCGHSYMKQKVMEEEAVLGGEFSGHIFFRENWFGFDDGMYAGARLLKFLDNQTRSLDQLVDGLSGAWTTPEIKLAVGDEEKFEIMSQLTDNLPAMEGLCTLDGVRLDQDRSWGLIRASNTSAALTLRFEGEDPESLAAIAKQFEQWLANIRPEVAQQLTQLPDYQATQIA